MSFTESKVFGIGLSKTGTSSLDRALNELGIRSIHFPSDAATYAELRQGYYQLSILQHYQAATDIAIAPFYPHLDAVYPNSKFILTIRDVDPWLDSVRDHWSFIWQWAEHDRYFCEFLKFTTSCAFGTHQYQRDRFIYVYQKHVRDVQQYFHGRPNDLLVLDICGGDGWERLCPFLGLPIPRGPFPFANRREEKAEPLVWMQTLKQAACEFRAIVPAAERYLLIDDQHVAGSELDDPSRVRRMMELNGMYMGPPTDSAAAIAEIHRLRSEGFNYLVVYWSSFWWLAHYPELHTYLRERFRTILANDRLLVVDLRGPDAR